MKQIKKNSKNSKSRERMKADYSADSKVSTQLMEKINRINNSKQKVFLNIPSFIFRDRNVAVLESLVEHLHDTEKLSFHEIAVLLNRNDRTIWTVYSRVKVKRTNELNKNQSNKNQSNKNQK